jgi:hypothetical protein
MELKFREEQKVRTRWGKGNVDEMATQWLIWGSLMKYSTVWFSLRRKFRSNLKIGTPIFVVLLRQCDAVKFNCLQADCSLAAIIARVTDQLLMCFVFNILRK